MAFSFLPREDEYFTLFTQITEKIQEATKLLVQMVSEENADLLAYARQIKDVEHSCDEITHKVTTKLARSFITPFDREDILELTRALDEVIDWIDQSAERIVILQISRLTPMVTELARIIHRSAEEIRRAVYLLRGMKDPEPVVRACRRIVQLENDADQVLREALRLLFQDSQAPPLEVIKLKELYENLEMATDRCQDVANILHTIIAKHT